MWSFYELKVLTFGRGGEVIGHCETIIKVVDVLPRTRPPPTPKIHIQFKGPWTLKPIC